MNRTDFAIELRAASFLFSLDVPVKQGCVEVTRVTRVTRGKFQRGWNPRLGESSDIGRTTLRVVACTSEDAYATTHRPRRKKQMETFRPAWEMVIIKCPVLVC